MMGLFRRGNREEAYGVYTDEGPGLLDGVAMMTRFTMSPFVHGDTLGHFLSSKERRFVHMFCSVLFRAARLASVTSTIVNFAVAFVNTVVPLHNSSLGKHERK